MNRRARRAEEARTRAAAQRHTAVAEAVAYMATADDPTITGATILTADGELLYVSADVARAMAPGTGRRGGGTC